MKIGFYLSAHKTEMFSQRLEPNEKTIIRNLNLNDAKAELEKLKEDILNNWAPDRNNEHFWGRKIFTTIDLIEHVESNMNGSIYENISLGHSKVECYKYSAFFMGESMIAMAEWHSSFDHRSQGIIIENIFTHPGVRSAGAVLIEHLVNMSNQLGDKGIIRLRALEQAIPAYENLGFTMDIFSFSSMTLKPYKCEDKWYINKNGEWKFTGDTEGCYSRPSTAEHQYLKKSGRENPEVNDILSIAKAELERILKK
ncbi:hypothetical protein ERYG_04216 [Escherichia coli M114]|nr:hypothetical protein ERYG_04216 [Escherichia coli M114]